MTKYTIVFILQFFVLFTTQSQPLKPYKTRLLFNGPIIIGGAGLSLLGLTVLRDKERLDSAFVTTLTPEDVNRFDRSATRHHHKNAQQLADFSLYGSFLLPLALLADNDIRSDAGQIGVMYLTTMAVMANAYTWGVSPTKRIRPYVYNPDVPFSKKLGVGTRNSFYAGHPAAAAAATFFAAKVFSDYHPESKLRTVLFGVALVPPALVAYYRFRRGQHFPTDIIAGIPLGMAIGVLIPHLHKQKVSKLTITPVNSYYHGLLLCYKL